MSDFSLRNVVTLFCLIAGMVLACATHAEAALQLDLEGDLITATDHGGTIPCKPSQVEDAGEDFSLQVTDAVTTSTTSMSLLFEPFVNVFVCGGRLVRWQRESVDEIRVPTLLDDIPRSMLG